MTPRTPSIRASGKRAATVIAIPREGNRVYGDDVPMAWQEAARHTGIPARTFWSLIERKEITSGKIGRRVMIKPSAIRAYLKLHETQAL